LGIDALIQPIWPSPAFKREVAEEHSGLGYYCHIWNMTCFPTGVLPITKVREDEQTYSDTHNDKLTHAIRVSCEDAVDLPIGVQVVSHSFEDEKALGIMKVIEENIQKYQ
jgi:fatty acid amide hydrolase